MFPRSSKSRRGGFSWAVIADRTMRNRCIESGPTSFYSPLSRSRTPTTNDSCAKPGHCRRRFGPTPHSTIPSNRLSEFHGMKQTVTANGSAQTPEESFACLPKPNGNARLAEAARAHCFPGATHRRSRNRAMPIAAMTTGRPAPNLWVLPNPIHMACTTRATTSMSGAVTGTRLITMRYRPSVIHAVLKPARDVPPAAVPGVTTSRFRVARPVPAFLPSSSIRTTGFASPATLSWCKFMSVVVCELL